MPPRRNTTESLPLDAGNAHEDAPPADHPQDESEHGGIWSGNNMSEHFSRLVAERLIPIQRERAQAAYVADESAADAKRKAAELETAERTFLATRSSADHDAIESARRSLKMASDAAEIARREVSRLDDAIAAERKAAAREALQDGARFLNREAFASRIVASTLDRVRDLRGQLLREVEAVSEEVRKREKACEFARELAAIAGIDLESTGLRYTIRGFSVDDVQMGVRRALTEENKQSSADARIENWIASW